MKTIRIIETAGKLDEAVQEAFSTPMIDTGEDESETGSEEENENDGDE